MTLAADRLAAPSGSPSADRLVLVHGFTQTRTSWAAIAGELNAGGHEVLCVDAPGHGDSDSIRIDLPAAALLLGRTAGRATYIGYSMGGRLALHLAVARPELVDRLVLVSSTAGIDDETERAARRADDERRAAAIEAHGVAAFLAEWLALPLFANLPTDQARLDERLANTASGLASSLRLAGTGAQQSLWPHLASLTMPVLLVVGQGDEKFTRVAEQIAALLPKSTVVVVPDAGHVVHLERPVEFVEALRRWIAVNPIRRAARASVDPPAEGQTERREGTEDEL